MRAPELFGQLLDYWRRLAEPSGRGGSSSFARVFSVERFGGAFFEDIKIIIREPFHA